MLWRGCFWVGVSSPVPSVLQADSEVKDRHFNVNIPRTENMHFARMKFCIQEPIKTKKATHCSLEGKPRVLKIAHYIFVNQLPCQHHIWLIFLKSMLKNTTFIYMYNTFTIITLVALKRKENCMIRNRKWQIISIFLPGRAVYHGAGHSVMGTSC